MRAEDAGPATLDRVRRNLVGLRMPRALEVLDHTMQQLERGEIGADQVVVAAGYASGAVAGLPEQVRAAIRPVKGQLLRLRHPDGMPPVISHTIRATVRGADVYLVPRADGEVVVGGATVGRSVSWTTTNSPRSAWVIDVGVPLGATSPRSVSVLRWLSRSAVDAERARSDRLPVCTVGSVR